MKGILTLAYSLPSTPASTYDYSSLRSSQPGRLARTTAREASCRAGHPLPHPISDNPKLVNEDSFHTRSQPL
jgi:hypothetical protein